MKNRAPTYGDRHRMLPGETPRETISALDCWKTAPHPQVALPSCRLLRSRTGDFIDPAALAHPVATGVAVGFGAVAGKLRLTEIPDGAG